MFFTNLICLASLAIGSEWRSPDFQKAKTELKSQIEKRGGVGVVLEMKRAVPNKITFQAEAVGEGAWVLKSLPKSKSGQNINAETLIKWSIDGFFMQSRPLEDKFSVPDDEIDMLFALNTKSFGSLVWERKLPTVEGQPTVMVFYVPSQK